MATTWLTGLSNPHGIVFRGNYVYIADNPRIWRFSINPDGSAGTPYEWVTGVAAFWILINGNTMYVTCSDGTITKILMVGDSVGTVTNSWATGLENPNGLVIYGNYLYAANGAGSTSITQINLANGATVLQNWIDPNQFERFHSLVVKGNFMYGTNFTGGISSVAKIQINPDGSAGAIVGNWALVQGYATELIIVEPYMYVADSTSGNISQISMSNGSVVNSTWASGFTTPHSFALLNGCLYVASYSLGTIFRTCSADLLLSDAVVVTSCDASVNTFRAFRPRSSSELLSLRKTQIQQSLNTVPSINIQDSSEVTARLRKYASVMPSMPLHGNSATLVKFKASSVVQSMVAGQAYRNSASSWTPRLPFTSPGCSTLLTDSILYPKVFKQPRVISNAAPQVVPFNPVVELPLRKNDNKVVLQRAVSNTAGCGVNQ
jgi:hypothetical protein